MRAFILTADRWVGRVIMALAVAALAVAALVGFYQVITRFVFQQPSSWSEVLTRALIVWSVFLGLSAAFLASLGFWTTLPWVLKVPLGHLVDLYWRHKHLLVWAGGIATQRQWDLEAIHQAVMGAWLERADLIRQWQLRLREEPADRLVVAGLGSQHDWEQRCEAMLLA